MTSLHKTYLNQGVADCSQVHIEFTGGIDVQIQVSWLHPFKEQKLSVIGESAMAVFDDTQDWPHKLVLREDYFQTKEVTSVPIPEAEPLTNECQHFLECCLTRSAPKTDPGEAIGVLRILEAAEQSAREQGRRIDLPPHQKDYCV